MTAVSVTCPHGVAPEDVAGWLLDQQPLPEHADEAHLHSCPACRQTLVAMGSTRQVRDQLRTPIYAPTTTVSRVLHRVRLEMLAGEVIATFVAGVADMARDLLGTNAQEER